jgi:hypothetical protein
MKAKVYKVELLIIDPENCRNQDDVIYFLENVKYLYPKVKSIKTAEIDWDDDHPLNKKDTQDQACQELFEEYLNEVNN